MPDLHRARTAASITALAQRIMETNLCKEIELTSTVTLELGVFYAPHNPLKTIKMPPNLKYQFSRAKWHTVDIGSGGWRLSREYNEIIEWCTKQFGSHPKKPDAWSRWWVGVGKIYFRDSNDYVLYQLRWA